MIKPQDLARDPVRMPLVQTNYDHNLQIRLGFAGEQGALGTPNATQTFDGQGKPRDSDHDK